MQKLIECGERTVQKLGRISIADIMKTHELEPGDVVVVDVKVPYSSDDLDDTESFSSKEAVMSAMRCIDTARSMMKSALREDMTLKERKKQVKQADEFLVVIKSLLKLDFVISDDEFKAYCKAEDGEDEEEEEGESE